MLRVRPPAVHDSFGGTGGCDEEDDSGDLYVCGPRVRRLEGRVRRAAARYAAEFAEVPGGSREVGSPGEEAWRGTAAELHLAAAELRLAAAGGRGDRRFREACAGERSPRGQERA